MTTKAEIGKIFKKLEAFGFLVKSFGDNRSLRKGAIGFVDIVIYNAKYLIFCETKSKDTNDKLNDAQKLTAKYLSSISALNKGVHYFIIRDVAEAKRLQEWILRGEL